MIDRAAIIEECANLAYTEAESSLFDYTPSGQDALRYIGSKIRALATPSRDCNVCGGTGNSSFYDCGSDAKKCDNCNGTGKIAAVPPAPAPNPTENKAVMKALAAFDYEVERVAFLQGYELGRSEK